MTAELRSAAAPTACLCLYTSMSAWETLNAIIGDVAEFLGMPNQGGYVQLAGTADDAKGGKLAASRLGGRRRAGRCLPSRLQLLRDGGW